MDAEGGQGGRGAFRFLRRLLRRSPDGGVRYGLSFFVLASVPLALYLGAETVPEEYRPLFVAERPGEAAVRAYSGPDFWRTYRPVDTPEFVKAVYATSSTVGWKSRFDEIVDMVDRTELNALVIDVKDWRGQLAFEPRTEELKPHAAERPPIPDLDAFTEPLREKGIYLIARVFVFQDPAFVEARPDLAVQNSWGGVWRDYRGIAWLDPAAEEVWEYNALVAREVFERGFDEVQFDYIRFPSDGSLRSAKYPVWDGEEPKHEVMARFFSYLNGELRLKRRIPTSVDLFGLTLWQHDYDLNIGQLLRDALPNFDYISPMVYPSHYPSGFYGFENPAAYPYEVVYENMVRGQRLVERMEAEYDELIAAGELTARPELGTIRPWLQDFDLGAVYTAPMVRSQMTATEDGGGSGWLLWNAGNVYTVSALEPAGEDVTTTYE